MDFTLIDKWCPEAIAALQQPKPELAIYIAGKVIYKDVYGRPRFTEFCVFVEPEDTVALIKSEVEQSEAPTTIRFVSSHVGNAVN